MKKKCSSTLAAETQITSEALAEVEWIRGLYEELTNPRFNIVTWAAKSRSRGLMVAARSSDAPMRLPKVLSIGDSKILYDHLRTETSGVANDRRTAMDIQIIGSSMEAQGATVRWVDHSGMYVDAMTKTNGNIPLLQVLLRTGRICITEETAILERHRTQPSSRSSSSKTRVHPATHINDTVRGSETKWSGSAFHASEAQNQKKIFGKLSTCVIIYRQCWFCIFSARCALAVSAEVLPVFCPSFHFSALCGHFLSRALELMSALISF